MGKDVTGAVTTPDQTRAFSKALLRDLRALERMLKEGRIESGVRPYLSSRPFTSA